MRQRWGAGSRWLFVFMAAIILLGAVFPAGGLAYAQERRTSHAGKEVMYFGIVQESGIGNYTISTVPFEMSFRGGVASQAQTNVIVHAVVGDATEVVTLDGSGTIEPGTPVVIAGYESGGIVEARVIGDLHTAKPTEGSVPVAEVDANTPAANPQSIGAMAAKDKYSELPSVKKPHEITRYTTISGSYEKMVKGLKESPMWTVGPLSISFYAEFFTGADIQWDWPFEIVAKLHDPLRYVSTTESMFQKGETGAQRYERMKKARALMTVDFVPQDPQTKRSFYGEVGLRLTVGIKGTIFGEQFNVPIDINKLASLAGGLGTHLSVGGKKAPPLWGQSEAIGIKDNIGINEDIVECTVGCTIDFFSEDVVGVTLPFFEAGVFSLGFAFQPFVVVYGDMPKLVNIKATNGLVAEKISDYSILGFRNNPNVFVPVRPDTIINPYDALALVVEDQIDSESITTPALTEGAELSFDTRYEPEATVGYMIQTSIKISKLGLSSTLNAPMAFVPLPFKFKLSGGKGAIALTDYDGLHTSADYTQEGSEAIYFSPEQIAGSMRLADADLSGVYELREAVSGAPYESQPFRALGGVGEVKLKAVGLVPGGLKLTAKGDGYYVLEGIPAVKEGQYSVNIRGTDSSGFSKDMTVQLPVAKVYPEKLDVQLTEGQSWSQTFELVAPDGIAYDHADLTWSLAGGQPGMSFVGNNLRINSVLPGEHSFEVHVQRNDIAELYTVQLQKHRVAIHATGLASTYQWQTTGLIYSEDVSTAVGSSHGAAVWDPGRGKIAMVSPGSGNYGLVLDGEMVKRANPSTLPIILNGSKASMSYAAPPGKDGWMYIFDQHLYGWNRDGTGGLLHLNRYEEGPTVEDPMTAALPDGRLLIFGGRSSGFPTFPVQETWIYDPNLSAMTKLYPDVRPGERFGSAAMVYVPEMDKVVLIGGDYSTKADGTIDDRQMPDGGIWLFDPHTLQWSQGLASHTIPLEEGDASQLVYARNEQKLYVLITGEPSASARLFSISISNEGQMGPLMNETMRLPAESALWRPRGGLLAFDEHKSALTYIQDDKVSSYQLPDVNADRSAIAADGIDSIQMDFNLNAYLNSDSELDDWTVEWRPVGDFKPWSAVATSPDSAGFVSLALTHQDMLLTEGKTAHWILYAQKEGIEMSIAKATFEVVPAPPDMENSSVELTPDHLSDLNGLYQEAGITDIAELTITLRSSSTVAEDNGLPLQDRELILLNARELEEQGIRVSKGDRNNLDDYVINEEYLGTTVLRTDEAGQIHLTWLNDRADIGEYTLQFELQDGSDMIVAAVVAIEPFIPVPTNTEYVFEGQTNEGIWPVGGGVVGISFSNVNDWHYFGNEAYSLFEIVNGKLPKGVKLNERTGRLAGSPNEAGIFEADVRLPNQERTVRLQLTVTEQLKLAEEDRFWEHPGVVGENYYQSADVRVNGGVRPFAYEVTEGELPPGLFLDPETGIISGTFTQSWSGNVTIRLTDSSMPSPNWVSKRYYFHIENQKELGTSYSVFDELYVDSHARLWASKYAGIPVGLPEGVFSPWQGGTYFELKRPDTTTAIPFSMSVTGNGTDTLRIFYWNKDTEQWIAFRDQSSEMSDDLTTVTLIVHVEDDDELTELWEPGEGLFLYRGYERLRLAVGSEAPAKPIVSEVRKVPSGLDVVQQYFIKGEHFTPDAKVYFGAREGMNTSMLDSNTLVSVVPPGEGSKHVYVINYAGASEANEAAVYTYPEEMKIPKEDVRLKLSMLMNSNWPEDRPPNLLLLDNEILVEVQLVDNAGKSVRPDDVEMSESDRRITITNWGNASRMKVINYPGDAVDDSPYVPQASRLVGRLNDDGFYRAVLRLREASDSGGCEEAGEGCGEPGEPEEPGEGTDAESIEPFEVDISVETPGGLYNRGSVDAAPEQIREYDQAETLQIVTESLPAGGIDDPYHAELEGTGGRSGGYRWYWGSRGDIPPGIELDPFSGTLRDLSGDEKREGEYIAEIVLSDGVVSTRKSFTIRIANDEESSEPESGGGNHHSDDSVTELSKELIKELAGKIKVRVDRSKAGNATDISVRESVLPADAPSEQLLSPVFQVRLLPQNQDSDKVPGAVEIHYDASVVPNGYAPKLFVFSETNKEWIELEGSADQGVIRSNFPVLGHFVVLAVKSPPIFIDISGHWAEKWIEQGFHWGIVEGYSDGTFRPELPITRIEFIVMLMRALDIENDQSETTVSLGYADEKDIPEWGRNAAFAASLSGIVDGYEDGTLRPLAKISRAEMIVMMARAFKLPQADANALLGYHDYTDIPEWSAASFASALKYGVIEGVGNNRLLPLSFASRAEMITVLVRAKLQTKDKN